MKHVKLFEAFVNEAKYTELESVGSFIDKDGMIYPAMTNSKPDLDAGVELSEVDDEWLDALSKEDKKIISKFESLLVEKQLKGLNGIAGDQHLKDISAAQKLKIIQGTGNNISFKVPEGSDRNFWQVFSKGKIKKKKSIKGEIVYYLPGNMLDSPSFKSEKDLINGVDWDGVEQTRRFNESINISEKKITFKWNDDDQSFEFSDGEVSQVDYDGEFKYKNVWFSTVDHEGPEDLIKDLEKEFKGTKFKEV